MFRLVVLLALLGEGCQGGQYECGTTLEDSTEDHQCDRTDEVCVCGTHSCAFNQHDTKECPSGYRYADSPFVSDDALAKKCVPATLTGHLIEATTSIKTCAAPVDAGVDATIDAMPDVSSPDATVANGGVS